jgi:hypothetical protein
VGDVERGDAQPLLDVPDLLAQVDAHLGVERRQRLVEQQDGGLDSQRAGQRHALLLTARELVRVVVDARRQADELEQLRGTGAALVARDLAHAQPELDVLAGRHVGEQAVGLEHHAHVALAGRHRNDVAAVDQQLATGRLFEPGDDTQRRGLATAAGPEQRDQLAGLDLEREFGQRRHLAELLVDAM